MLKFVVFVCLIRRWFQRYHLSKNMILLILWRSLLIVSVFRCLCLCSYFFVFSSRKKKRNSAFDFVRSSISKSYDAVFFSISSITFDALFVSSITFDALFVSSIFLNVAFFFRFFVSFSNNYRDSLFVFRFRFLLKVSQKKIHVSFHFSINLKKKSVKYFSNFWKI